MDENGANKGTKQPEERDFEELYFRYYHRLYNFSFQFTRDEKQSQDLVHEVFLKFWERRAQICHESAGALLFRMTRNLCLNYVKHLKIVQNTYIDLSETRKWEELYRVEFLKDEPYMLIEQELQEKINKIMDHLPGRCCEVFRLSRLHGLKNAEIAEKLGISVKAVEKHIKKAIQEFRHKLPDFVPVPLIILVISYYS